MGRKLGRRARGRKAEGARWERGVGECERSEKCGTARLQRTCKRHRERKLGREEVVCGVCCVGGGGFAWPPPPVLGRAPASSRKSKSAANHTRWVGGGHRARGPRERGGTGRAPAPYRGGIWSTRCTCGRQDTGAWSRRGAPSRGRGSGWALLACALHRGWGVPSWGAGGDGRPDIGDRMGSRGGAQ